MTQARRPLLSLVALSVVIFAALTLRLPNLEHLLTWDEAMSLCSTRAFVGGGADYYSYWFWRHPPLHSTVLALARPLEGGFAERAVAVSIVFSLANLIALYVLNARVFGRAVALLSCAALAFMPSAIFYDTCIKQDVVTALPGLLSLLLFARRRYTWSGVLLGVAFLGKETALFFALCIAVLWWMEPKAQRRFKDLLVVAGCSVLVSGWWFAFFSVSVKHFFSLATGVELVPIEHSPRTWHFYLTRLYLDVGALGLGAAALGVLGIIAERRVPGAEPVKAWPVAMLVPAYLVLQLSYGKSPWFVIVLYPALATLTGLGLYHAARWLRSAMERIPGVHAPVARLVSALPVIVAVAILGLHARAFDWESYLGGQGRNLLWGSKASRQAAMAMNDLVQEGQNALITPMNYWPAETNAPDPIFVYYLKDMPVLVRPFAITAEELIADVRKHRIDWAMISTVPGPGHAALIDPLAYQYKLRPIVLDGAVIYKTTGLQ